MNRKTTLSITLILALLMGLFTTGMAFASEEDEVTGIVVEIIFEDDVPVALLLDTGEGDPIEVPFGKNFDPENFKIEIGDEVVIKTCAEDGDMVITELKIQERLRDRVQTQDGTLESNFCAVEEVVHPVAAKVADTYGILYEDMEAYLCGETHVPLGQIMLALATADLMEGVDFTEFLDGFENIKWGQIWQELDLKGKPGHGTTPGQIKQQGSDNDAGNEQTPPQTGK